MSLGDYASRSRIWEALEWVMGVRMPAIHYPHTVTSRTTRPLSQEDQTILQSDGVQGLLEEERLALMALYASAHLSGSSAYWNHDLGGRASRLTHLGTVRSCALPVGKLSTPTAVVSACPPKLSPWPLPPRLAHRDASARGVISV